MLLQQFSYQAEELRSFILSVDTFILTLKTGRTVHYRPNSIGMFLRWLLENNVRDSKKHLHLTELFR
ncbi:MAG: hypothetical protein EOP51_03365 [Sphingobacteriales bacterium]|nr:MAG: hypothetical protein EOP51_03365 [Sphingobacteriales bacterium]